MALLAYPFMIEPAFGLSLQSRIWRSGFLVLAILVLSCGLAARRLSRSLVFESTDAGAGVSRVRGRFDGWFWYSSRRAGSWVSRPI